MSDIMVVICVLIFAIVLFAIGFLLNNPQHSPSIKSSLHPPLEAGSQEPIPAESQHATNAVSDHRGTFRVVTTVHGDQPLPSGTYLGWPVPTFIALFVLGVLSAGAGSGGRLEGFVVAWLLNPINWGMAYAFFQIGKLKCPHCRRSARLGEARNAPVASPLTCPHCSNALAKPQG